MLLWTLRPRRTSVRNIVLVALLFVMPLLGTSPNHRRLRTGSVSRALAKNGFSSLLDTRPGHAVMLPREAADGAGHEEGVGSLVGERAQLRGARRG